MSVSLRYQGNLEADSISNAEVVTASDLCATFGSDHNLLKNGSFRFDDSKRISAIRPEALIAGARSLE